MRYQEKVETSTWGIKDQEKVDGRLRLFVEWRRGICWKEKLEPS
jgi:hypothetical protein